MTMKLTKLVFRKTEMRVDLTYCDVRQSVCRCHVAPAAAKTACSLACLGVEVRVAAVARFTA